jgi:hypothetical protein
VDWLVQKRAVKTGVLALLCLSSPVAAAEAETWGMRWNAPADCIQAAELAERVERRAGRMLFAGRAQRHVEGYLALEADAYRVRLTMVNDAGRILGTREFTQAATSCRALDDRIALTIALMVEPFDTPEPPRSPLVVEPQPAPPQVVSPLPPPAKRKLSLRDPDTFFVDARSINRELFYLTAGRRDLFDQYLLRQALKVTGFVVSTVVLLAAGGLLLAPLTGAGCRTFTGTPLFPGLCVQQDQGWFIAAGVTGVVGVGSLLWAALFRTAPTSFEQDQRLIEEFNAL